MRGHAGCGRLCPRLDLFLAYSLFKLRHPQSIRQSVRAVLRFSTSTARECVLEIAQAEIEPPKVAVLLLLNAAQLLMEIKELFLGLLQLARGLIDCVHASSDGSFVRIQLRLNLRQEAGGGVSQGSFEAERGGQAQDWSRAGMGG